MSREIIDAVKAKIEKKQDKIKRYEKAISREKEMIRQLEFIIWSNNQVEKIELILTSRPKAEFYVYYEQPFNINYWFNKLSEVDEDDIDSLCEMIETKSKMSGQELILLFSDINIKNIEWTEIDDEAEVDYDE